MILHPYTALACLAAGAAVLAAALLLACLVLALRLGKVTGDRDRHARAHLHALHERRQMVERLDATRLVISRPPRRPSVHFGDAELGAMVRARTIRLRSSTPTREGS